MVDTNHRGGQTMHKGFRVSTNDPKKLRVQLKITGKVIAFATIDPPYVRLIGRPGETISAAVRIQPGAAYPFTITDVKTGRGDNIRTELKPMGKDPAKDGYQLIITSAKNKVGTFRDYVVLHTDSKQKSTLRIPVSGRIRPERTGRKPVPAPK